MKGWSDKKYHYKIINENKEVIAYIHDFLFEVEKFTDKSHLHITRIERVGIDSFDIEVICEHEWKFSK